MKSAAITFTIFFSVICLSASAQDYRIESNEVKITKEIKFKNGTDELLPESDAALLIIKKYLDDKPYISTLRVEAHTDKKGDEAASQVLTEKRATAVCQRLVSLGAGCTRLLPVAFGSPKPVTGNGKNARISFVNAALNEKAIGGMPLDGGGKISDNPCH